MDSDASDSVREPADGAHGDAEQSDGAAAESSADAGMPTGEGGRDRTGRARLILAVAAVLVLVSGVAFGGWALRDQPGSCGGGKRLLITVAASPDIGPAMQEAASRFNARSHEVRGRCVRAEVAERDSADVIREVSGQGSSGRKVDGWVAESSMWVNLARTSPAGNRTVAADSVSVASSPVVMAVKPSVANELRADKGRVGWRLLFPGFARSVDEPGSEVQVSARVPDPASNASGLVSMIAGRRLIKDNRRTASVLTNFVRHVQRDVPRNSAEVLNSLYGERGGRGAKRLGVVPEQSVIGYNRGHRQAPATMLVPREGTFLLDYPFAVTSTDPRRKEAAESFRSTLRSRLTQNALQRHGFRTPEGKFGAPAAGEFKVSARTPMLMGKVQPGQVGEMLQAWNRLGLGSRILVLADVSGTMAYPLAGAGQTRMQVAQKAALAGLRLFPDDTDIGLWEFSTELNGKKDYRQLVPLGPINAKVGSLPRRERVERVAKTLKPRPQGDTGMYDTILAAYREVKRTWKPDKFNAVLMLTDSGGNDDAHGIGQRALLNKLRQEADPQRPIQVIIIAFGPDIDDPEPIRQIARATNGSSYVAKNPGDIVNVFLEAIGRRLCSPNCPTR